MSEAALVTGRGQLGGADGEGGLAHAARAINERAPADGVGMEVREELGEFGVATEEALDGGEVVTGRKCSLSHSSSCGSASG